MSHLPVFSTIGQAMAIFGLHIGKLFRWSLIPVVLSLVALGAAFGIGLWLQPAGGESSGFPYWWMAFVPAGVFCMMTWVPYAIRVNQLAVTGRIEPGGYVEMVFASVSLRYLGYAILVGFIQVAGIVISALPVFLVGVDKLQEIGQVRMALAIAVAAALMLAFFILTSPLNLIYPAASVEREPSLNRAYALGSHVKFRLFLCVVLSAILFAVLGQGLDSMAKAFGSGKSQLISMAVVPLQVILTFFSYVTSVGVPAVAYRVLAGLPDPQHLDDTGTTNQTVPPTSAASGSTPAGERNETPPETN
jgi:hypothetical protein